MSTRPQFNLDTAFIMMIFNFAGRRISDAF